MGLAVAGLLGGALVDSDAARRVAGTLAFSAAAARADFRLYDGARHSGREKCGYGRHDCV